MAWNSIAILPVEQRLRFITHLHDDKPACSIMRWFSMQRVPDWRSSALLRNSGLSRAPAARHCSSISSSSSSSRARSPAWRRWLTCIIFICHCRYLVSCMIAKTAYVCRCMARIKDPHKHWAMHAEHGSLSTSDRVYTCLKTWCRSFSKINIISFAAS